MQGISKGFPGVQALDDVHLTCLAGEIHAIVGENGAGKSTLMKILAGAYAADSGTIRMDGQEVRFASPHDSQARGIGMVYQELNLVPDLSVAENIYLGRQPVGRFGIVDRGRLHAQATDLLKALGTPIDARTLIRDLSVGQQQMVEIAKAYSQDPRVLVLDEPTSALTEHETAILFATLGRLRDEGIAIIFISHRLKEVMEVAARVTVLRDGKFVGSRPIAELTAGEIVNMMVGRDVTELFPKRKVAIGDVVLQISGFARSGVFRDVSFSVREGEILGLAGLVGAGRTEVARSIFGLDPHDAGEIRIDGQAVRIRSPRDAVKAHMGYVPEDRKRDGLVLGPVRAQQRGHEHPLRAGARRLDHASAWSCLPSTPSSSASPCARPTPSGPWPPCRAATSRRWSSVAGPRSRRASCSSTSRRAESTWARRRRSTRSWASSPRRVWPSS